MVSQRSGPEAGQRRGLAHAGASAVQRGRYRAGMEATRPGGRPGEGARAVPPTLRIGAGLLAAQGVLLVIGSLAYAVVVAVHPAESRAGGEAAAISLLLAGAVLAVLGGLLLRRQRVARGPSVFLQLFALPVAYFLAQAGLWWIAVPVAVVCVAVVVLLNTRDSLLALGIIVPRDD